ncbi:MULTISPECIES: TetR/AcrR family transcriptional regulator [unclassified Isoptericola]|uniref:TetR/AcrR family transcriptional regulator n=1 Tax=unclassified Isoptericola TaxID=2623355 RepID=UPI0036677355
MARWEPDARGRMTRAALDLYTEQGFEQTTTAQIAERAGVTERTYFRHFADKREVLFDGSHELEALVTSAVAGAPDDAAPLDAVGAAFVRVAGELEDRREFAARRAAVVAATPRLRERELLKLAALRDDAAAALRARGVPEPAASMVAEVGVAAFKVGFEAWIASGQARPVADEVRDALTALRDQAAV